MRITQGLIRAATVASRATSTIDGGTTRLWGETSARVARLAAGLAGLGVRPGDRVAVLALNSDVYFESYYAIPWAGGVLTPLNTRLAPAELAFQLRDAGARILLYGREFAATAARLRAEGAVATLVALDEPDAGSDADLAALIAAHAPAEDAGRGGTDLAGIFYTGGTTGLPKGVMLTHTSLHTMAVNLVMSLGIDDTIVNFHAAPMFHLADIGLLFVTMVGGVHVIQRSFDAADMVNAIAAHRVTHCFTVPAVIDRMARHALSQSLDLSSLKVLGYGGAPMPTGTYENARARFPSVDFVQGFGQTEFAACTFLAAKYHRDGADPEKRLSAGQVCYGYEIKIVDEAGVEVPRRAVGEIVGRGANAMIGYWNRPEETAETLRDGWVHTRDAGFMDEDGFIYITDRLKDMIVSGAENVYSIEVENAVSRHPAVAECAVIGVPDAKWGERVHAIAVLNADATLTLEDLAAFCRDQIAGYKLPRSLDIHAGPLPRNAAGKVLKAELRAPYWAGHTRKI